MTRISSEDSALLAQFVAAFSVLDELKIIDPDEVLPEELSAGIDDSRWAHRLWRPATMATERDALDELYRSLPGRFPPLYEHLLLSYRWLAVDLKGFVRLYANPPAPHLALLRSKMTADGALTEILFPHKLLPFGIAGDNYDPICFDARQVDKNGDCPVVRAEHEAILCDGKLGDTWLISASFRELIQAVIGRAQINP